MSACQLEHERSLSVAWVQVKYASLPNFEEREEDFRADSVVLRRRFTEDGVPPAPSRLCCDVLATCTACVQPYRPLNRACGCL